MCNAASKLSTYWRECACMRTLPLLQGGRLTLLKKDNVMFSLAAAFLLGWDEPGHPRELTPIRWAAKSLAYY